MHLIGGNCMWQNWKTENCWPYAKHVFFFFQCLDAFPSLFGRKDKFMTCRTFRAFVRAFPLLHVIQTQVFNWHRGFQKYQTDAFTHYNKSAGVTDTLHVMWKTTFPLKIKISPLNFKTPTPDSDFLILYASYFKRHQLLVVLFHIHTHHILSLATLCYINARNSFTKSPSTQRTSAATFKDRVSDEQGH